MPLSSNWISSLLTQIQDGHLISLIIRMFIYSGVCCDFYDMLHMLGPTWCTDVSFLTFLHFLYIVISLRNIFSPFAISEQQRGPAETQQIKGHICNMLDLQHHTV